MQLKASDPDLETLIRRIDEEELDLQPDFQRGEVWSKPERQRLIDSVLRAWHIPPVHIVVDPESGKEEVLDGQQRLAAIRDFSHGAFPLDGTIEPLDEGLSALHGLRYMQLPEAVRRRFDRFELRVYRLVDYTPAEPGELFFRLNQQKTLNPAEKRNAFFGPARSAVKKLVKNFENHGLTPETLGFSNSRMAYDEVVARVCATVQENSIGAKVTARRLERMYRDSHGFEADAVSVVAEAIRQFGEAQAGSAGSIKYNKATLFSWLVFVARPLRRSGGRLPLRYLGEYIAAFESSRRSSLYESSSGTPKASSSADERLVSAGLFSVFNDRAASRVSDVASVTLRDFILWLLFNYRVGQEVTSVLLGPEAADALGRFWHHIKEAITHAQIAAGKDELEEEGFSLEEILLETIDQVNWEILS